MCISDSSPNFEKAIEAFATRYPSSHTPNPGDLNFLRSLSAMLSHRSAAIVAAGVGAGAEERRGGSRGEGVGIDLVPAKDSSILGAGVALAAAVYDVRSSQI